MAATPRSGSGRVELWRVVALKRVPFPQGAHLWVCIDEGGWRREAVQRRRQRWGPVVPVGEEVELRVRRGRGKYAAIEGVESGGRWVVEDPVRYTFAQWVAELVELGLHPEDPHPELYRLLAKQIATEAPTVPPAYWGQMATEIMRIYGIWAPADRCPGCGAAPPGEPAATFGCPGCYPLPRQDVVLTVSGAWVVPLARWLDLVDEVYEQALHRRPNTSAFVRELGTRGLLGGG